MEVLKRGLVLLMVFMVFQRGEGQLSENFYRGTCPSLEMIVKLVVSTKFSQTFVTIPATLRLFFHDCFVEVGWKNSMITLDVVCSLSLVSMDL